MAFSQKNMKLAQKEMSQAGYKSQEVQQKREKKEIYVNNFFPVLKKIQYFWMCISPRGKSAFVGKCRMQRETDTICVLASFLTNLKNSTLKEFYYFQDMQMFYECMFI